MVKITEALLIKRSPLEKILHGNKVYEVRGEACNIRGWVGLIQSCGEGADENNGYLRAVVHMRGCWGPFNINQMNEPTSLMLAGRDSPWEELPYALPYFWIFDEIQELEEPFVPPRKQGQVKWVKFNPALEVEI